MSRTAQRGVIARIGGPVVTVALVAAGAVLIARSTGTTTCRSAPTPAPAVQLAAQTTVPPETTQYVFRAQWTGFQPNEVNILYTDYQENGRRRMQVVLDKDKDPDSWQTVITAPNGSKPTLTVTPPPPACNNAGMFEGFSVSCTVYLVTTSNPADSMIGSNVQAHRTENNKSAVCDGFVAGTRKYILPGDH